MTTEFVPQELRSLAKREGKKFAGSTSSLSGMLCHTYFLLSEYKDVDYSSLSQHFKNQVCAYWVLITGMAKCFSLAIEFHIRTTDADFCFAKL